MKREYPENKILMSMPEKMRKVIAPEWHLRIRTPETESEIIDNKLSQCDDDSIKGTKKDSTLVSDDFRNDNLMENEISNDDVEDESTIDAD